MNDVSYKGWAIRDMALSFTVPMTGDESWVTAAPIPEREVTIRLQQGQAWTVVAPNTLKRGQTVDIDIQGHPFVGRVKYRRLNRLVIRGRFQ